MDPDEVTDDRGSSNLNSRGTQRVERSLTFIGHLLCTRHSAFAFSVILPIRLNLGY